MKKNLFTLCCILVSCFSFSQENSKEFTDLKKLGDSLYKIKDYKNSALAYTSAIGFANPLQADEVNNTRWAAACSWSLGNYPDSSFFLLNRIADTKDFTFSYFIDIILDNDFNPLHTDKRWEDVKNKMFLKAKQAFTSGLQKSKGIVPDYERVNAALAWALMNNKDSTFLQLQAIANAKGVSFGTYNNIRTTNLLSLLHNDNRWQPLMDKIFKNAEKSFLSPQDATYTQAEIIYGRKDGMALTMMHLKPGRNSNGRAIISIMSGGWRSSLFNWDYTSFQAFLQKGYSVFLVAHGSAPVYSIPDAIADIQRAVRFIRYNAKNYQIDPNKIGVTGASAGGHLSLLCGLIDTPIDTNGDPVSRLSAKVQAVACYYPPTDFLNWGNEGNALGAQLFTQNNTFNHLFEFRQWNAQRRQFKYVTDTTELNKILKEISPINHVSPNDAPVLILHGDKDDVVPLQQSESLVKKLKEANVPVSLTTKKGAGHGWDRNEDEIKMFIEWFDKYLK